MRCQRDGPSVASPPGTIGSPLVLFVAVVVDVVVDALAVVAILGNAVVVALTPC